MTSDSPEQHARNESSPTESKPSSRRSFLIWTGRGIYTAALGAAAFRVLGGRRNDAAFDQPAGRCAWQIDPDKCTFCGKCETACVQTPSAVRAVNDQTKCSNCVICYGHIYNLQAPSDKIDEQIKVCPQNAVKRTPFSGGQDGNFLYTIRDDLCTGCGDCAKQCNTKGTKSMFLVIRPDLCLGCHECAIVKACPSDAIQFVPMQSATDHRPS